jgi:hypothetical protein
VAFHRHESERCSITERGQRYINSGQWYGMVCVRMGGANGQVLEWQSLKSYSNHRKGYNETARLKRGLLEVWRGERASHQ